MNYVSLFSGIEAASVAWHPLGWSPLAFCEVDPFCRSLLAVRYPGVVCHADIQQQEWGQYAGRTAVVVGGSPCQAFSVAGLRRGLGDPRGNLTLAYLAAVDAIRPRWMVWENVPGVLSIDEGRVFGQFLGALGQLGYGFAYRVLDAQYFGLAQQRQRVFVVGYLGDWRPPSAVLFERESLRGNPAPRREARQTTAADIAPSLTASGRGVERTGESRGQDPVAAAALNASSGKRGPGADDAKNLIVGGGPDEGRITGAVSSKWSKGAGGPAGDEAYNLVAHTLRGEGCDASEDGTGRGTPLVPCHSINARQDPDHKVGRTGPLDQDGGSHAVAFQPRYARNGRGAPSDIAAPLTAEAGRTGKGDSAQCIAADSLTVRRLTPRECERLQGFPDDYTLIEHRGRPAKDGPRYRALGNSMAVPVMRWIAERIALVEGIVQAHAAEIGEPPP